MRTSAANLEVERRLDRFAQVRLTPDAEAVARMRARVMREARLSLGPVSPAATAAIEIDKRRSVRRALYRRAGALLAAALLTLGVVGGTMAASRAGGPLYDVRVALEGLALPADPGARASAEVGRLDTRVQEALAAAAADDRPAVEAAMRAYDAIAAEALAGAGINLHALERIQAALSHHVDVLTQVAEKVPPQARDAIERNIERARERNSRLLERLQGAPPNRRPDPDSRPGGGPPVEPKLKPTKAPKAPETTEPAANPAETPKPAKPPLVTPQPAVDAGEQPSGPPSERPGGTPRGQGGGAP